ncbi:putative outer membrane efflux protein [Klebsiella pneumoniae]|uniref:Putative outer membrane efflux protein n=1 Tax=Klebsiella pneumoniae TaxID=573 RepID=A0A447S5F2_KLEPN|nr:putative outer membrane efflux protein [Klebsiella pneumoniae]
MNNGYSNTYSDSGYSPSLVVSVSQMLYDFGKVSSSVRAADAAVAQQQAMSCLISIRWLMIPRVQWYSCKVIKKLVKIAQAQVDSLKHIGDLIRQRNDAGATSLSDVVQTDTRVEGAQATLIQYQAALERWKANAGDVSWSRKYYLRNRKRTAGYGMPPAPLVKLIIEPYQRCSPLWPRLHRHKPQVDKCHRANVAYNLAGTSGNALPQ